MGDRREFLKGAAAAAAFVGVGPTVVAACAKDASTSDAAGSAAATTPDVGPISYDPDVPYWMQGGFAPVSTETEAFDLPVSGALPPELTGLYVRNGSNPSSGSSPHWFLGDGMVHGVRLDAGTASWYRNRYVDTPMKRDGKGLLGGGAPGGANNQSNVSVFHHAGKLLSSGEVGFPYELSTADLSTIGPYDYAGRLTTAMTAHPKLDPATGKLHFFGYGFVPPYLTYHVAATDGALEYSEEIAVSGPTMIHDFAITDTDAVFWEMPVVFDMDLAIKMASGDPTVFPFRWEPSYGSRLGVMPLDGPTSAIRWVEIDNCFVFHGVNAWRDGTKVVVDACRLPSFQAPGGDGPPALHRWTIDTSAPDTSTRAMTAKVEQLSDVAMDLPAVDRRFVGRSNRQSWLLMTDPDAASPVEFAGLARRDEATGELDRYTPGVGYRLNEGFFVSAGDGSGEGEGWLMAYAWDRARGASDLVVLDAGNLAAGPVAQVHLPVRVPYGFHGAWVSGGS